MNVEVTVKGVLTSPDVKIRALVANLCPITHISRRLANKLGLMQFKSIYIGEGYSGDNSSYKWKISLNPIVVSSADLGNIRAVAYPVIDCTEDDKFIEMVIGRDIQSQWPNVFNIGQADHRRDETLTPSPGPGFREGVIYMGHNIKLASADDVPKDEWYEYFTMGAVNITRVAVHKANRQLAVVEAGSSAVIMYGQLPENLERLLDEGGDRDAVLATVKQVCTEVSSLEAFPETTLLIKANQVGVVDIL